MLIEATLFIVVGIFVAYLVIYAMKSNKSPFQGKEAVYDLSKENQIFLPSNEFVWTESPCSVRFAIFVTRAPRTIVKVDCVDTSDPVTSFAPNCSDYTYKGCKCNGANCVNCELKTNSSGYMSNLLNIGDYVEFWASGYTNQNDKPYVPALLKVRTGISNSQHYMESIPLPAIPLQKWTVITIAKEGRRWDIYYGAKLQTSKLTDYVPIAPDMSKQWMGGNSMWQGQIGFFRGFNKTQFAPDVLDDVEKLVDTRGIPYYMNYPRLDQTIGPTAPCIFGDCEGSLPDIKPPNPFSSFSSNVS